MRVTAYSLPGSDSRLALALFLPAALAGFFAAKAAAAPLPLSSPSSPDAAATEKDARGGLGATVGGLGLVLLALTAIGVRSGYLLVMAVSEGREQGSETSLRGRQSKAARGGAGRACVGQDAQRAHGLRACSAGRR